MRWGLVISARESIGRLGERKVKHIIAAGLIGAGAASGAWAQSTVTLYGSLDAGVAYVSNSGGHAKWMEEQGNMQPDRWGIRAVEDLGRRAEVNRAVGEWLLHNHWCVCEERCRVEPAGFRGSQFRPVRQGHLGASNAIFV